MNSQTTLCDPYLTDEELNKFRNCITLRKTFLLLASRKQPSAYKRKLNRQKNCLQWIRQWGKLDNDDPSLVDVLYDVITQYVFQRMPKEYLSETCKFHNYNCHCTIGKREHFVLNKLHELGIDVNKIRPQIDAAFIMTLENNSANVAWDGRPIDQASKRHVPQLLRRRKTSNGQKVSQLALRIGNARSQFVPFPETHDRVIVEYLPKTPQAFRSVLKPRNNNGCIRRLAGEWFEEEA
ncbi:hypothetical protein GE061_018818 [Apolygus lucorum]|uniref:Uncharacterized protein n=1 Tax=Apolygus lucorum TaxID=248454 RepID=A0A8S9X8G7_APOLU|nr:hypothetical protein GE061_018818 [Apolygus lucorum]